MKILVSGFEAFNNRLINNSKEVLDLLNADKYYKVILPVSYNRSFELLKKEIEKIKPDLVLCLGEAINRTDICIEKRAINIKKASICDNDNVIYNGECIIENGDEFLYSNILIDKVICNTNIIASLDAGKFVCNTLLYELLNYNKNLNKPMLCAFIHIPRLEKYKTIEEIKDMIELSLNIMED